MTLRLVSDMKPHTRAHTLKTNTIQFELFIQSQLMRPSTDTVISELLNMIKILGFQKFEVFVGFVYLFAIFN